MRRLEHLAGCVFGLLFNIILEPKIVLFFFKQVKTLFINILIMLFQRITDVEGLRMGRLSV